MEAWKEFRWFLMIVVLLWVVWFMSGGVSRYEEDKPYAERPTTPGEIQKTGPNYR